MLYSFAIVIITMAGVAGVLGKGLVTGIIYGFDIYNTGILHYFEIYNSKRCMSCISNILDWFGYNIGNGNVIWLYNRIIGIWILIGNIIEYCFSFWYIFGNV